MLPRFWAYPWPSADYSPLTARQLRNQYPGAIHHVMNRGARPEAIFLDQKDRGEACDETGWHAHLEQPTG